MWKQNVQADFHPDEKPALCVVQALSLRSASLARMGLIHTIEWLFRVFQGEDVFPIPGTIQGFFRSSRQIESQQIQ